MAVEIESCRRHVEKPRALGHKVRNRLDEGIGPADERRIILGMPHGLGGKRRAHLRVVQCKQMIHAVGIALGLTRDEIGQGRTSHALVGLLQDVAHIGHDQAREGHEFVWA